MLTLSRVLHEVDYAEPINVELVQHWMTSTYGPVQGAILTTLLANDVVTKRELAVRVWGDSPPSSLEASIRIAIYKLRLRLEEESEDWKIEVKRPSASDGRHDTTFRLVSRA